MADFIVAWEAWLATMKSITEAPYLDETGSLKAVDLAFWTPTEAVAAFDTNSPSFQNILTPEGVPYQEQEQYLLQLYFLGQAFKQIYGKDSGIVVPGPQSVFGGGDIPITRGILA